MEVRPGKKGEKEHADLGYESEQTFVVNVPDERDDDRRAHRRRRRRPARVRAGDRARGRRRRNDRRSSLALLVQQADAAPAAAGAVPASGRPDGALPRPIWRRRACWATTRRRPRWRSCARSWPPPRTIWSPATPRSPASRLFRIVESPRYAKFDYAPEYATAELTLARALIRAGRHQERPSATCCACSAAAPRRRSSRPPTARWSTSRSRPSEQAAILAVLDHYDQAARRARCPATAPPSTPTSPARSPTRRATRARAESLFGEVDRQSRFYAAALYFRGLIQARQSHFASARRNLCEIVEQADQDRFTFFIDGRYFAIKDLAYLALGRIAHEQGKYDDAYYFYFRVPDRLGPAAGRAVRGVVVDVPEGGVRGGARLPRRVRPHASRKSPLAPDVMLLHAMIDLKSCQFDTVRTTLDKFVKVYGPIEAQVAVLLKDPGQAGGALPAPAQQGLDRHAARSDRRAA